MESWEKVIASGAGVGAGTLGLWVAMGYANNRLEKYLHNDLHHKVNDACGVSLDDRQWTRLLGTEDWLKYRGSLPLLPWIERTGKILGPFLMSSVGSFVAGMSLESGLAEFVNLDGLKGFLALGAAFFAISAAKFFYFNGISNRFVAINSLSSDAPICSAARAIYNEGNRPTVTGLVEYEQVPNQSHVAKAIMQPRQAAAMGRRTPFHYHNHTRRVASVARPIFARPVFFSAAIAYR